MKLKPLAVLIFSILVCELVGIIGSVFTISSIPGWYATLPKPAFSPPNWIFGPVWTTLYLLMGIAAFLVWRKGSEKKEIRHALSIFGLQLFLNALWTPLFFGLHNPLLAFVEIILMWLSIVWTISVFNKISRPAALLLLPYILWVTFATYLNYEYMLATFTR